MFFDFTKLIEPALLGAFALVYLFVIIFGMALFYHFRRFGLRGDRAGKKIESAFVILNLILFVFNLTLLLFL